MPFKLLLMPAGMFKDADFQVKAGVDKRGRKVASGTKGKGEDMKRYYRLRDEVGYRNAFELQILQSSGASKETYALHVCSEAWTLARLYMSPVARKPVIGHRMSGLLQEPQHRGGRLWRAQLLLRSFLLPV